MAVSESIKRAFVTKIRTNLTEVIKRVRLLYVSIETFKQKGFAVGGTDPITDEHLAAIGIIAAELAEGKSVIDDLVAIVNTADILNILRNDLGIEEPR